MPETATKRVLLFDMPQLLRDLVRDAVSGQTDLEVVGELDDESQLDAAVSSTSPSVVIVGTDGAEISEACQALFEVRPRLRVLALATRRGRSVVWELAPRRVSLGEISPQSLLTALRKTRPWNWDA